MGYKAGQVVEVCSERSKRWTHGFNRGSRITLGGRVSDDEPFAGEWNATSSTGKAGIIAEKDFREVIDGPVRTVTRQEIIPGTYEGVAVRTPGDDVVNLHISYLAHDPSPGELDRAAAVLTALAGALRDGN